MAEKDIEFFGSDVDMPPLPPMINIINFDNYRLNNNNINNWSSSSSSHHEIVEEDEDEKDDGGFKIMPSITEEYENDLFSYDIDRNGNAVSDVVYVVTWRGTEELSSASMEALAWTLGTDLHESSIVYLVHVFPELRVIPTPRKCLHNLLISYST